MTNEEKIKVKFGLVAQGHIPIIEAEIKRWNDSYKEQFPDQEPVDMTYSIHVWESIGKKIGWSPFSAALAYLEWLNDPNREDNKIREEVLKLVEDNGLTGIQAAEKMNITKQAYSLKLKGDKYQRFTKKNLNNLKKNL